MTNIFHYLGVTTRFTNVARDFTCFKESAFNQLKYLILYDPVLQEQILHTTFSIALAATIKHLNLQYCKEIKK